MIPVARRNGCTFFAGDRAIARGRFQKRRQDSGKNLRTNERIRVSPVRLIGQDNEQVGIVDTRKAQEIAREAGLDLVEVAPNSTPPVCRIMDYGKWKYQQKKKEQKARAHAKQSELKEVRVRPKTDDHDMQIKIDKATEFLEDGHKVQFTMIFRGRENAHRDIGQQILLDLADELGEISKIETPPRPMGRRMTMMLAPDKSGGKSK